MNVHMHGPKNPIYTFLDDGQNMISSFDVNVGSLEEALEKYCTHFKVALRPNADNEDPSISNKYFIHTDLDTGRESLVDIHVLRGVKDHIAKSGKSICIEQNLNFEIKDQDIISMGPLIC